jgi:acetyltransferase EpsM
MEIGIYGASGHAKVLLDICEIGSKNSVFIYDDNLSVKELGGSLVHHEIKVGIQWLIGIGNNQLRKSIVKKYNFNFTKLIHPRSVLAKDSKIDVGTVIMAGAIVNSGCNVGKHVILNTNCSVDHDCEIEDYVHISPGATLCGNVLVKKGTHIGAGAVILPGVNIGEWATIGAGSVVVKDVSDGVTMLGNPARKFSEFLYNDFFARWLILVRSDFFEKF